MKSSGDFCSQIPTRHGYTRSTRRLANRFAAITLLYLAIDGLLQSDGCEWRARGEHREAVSRRLQPQRPMNTCQRSFSLSLDLMIAHVSIVPFRSATKRVFSIGAVRRESLLIEPITCGTRGWLQAAWLVGRGISMRRCSTCSARTCMRSGEQRGRRSELYG